MISFLILGLKMIHLEDEYKVFSWLSLLIQGLEHHKASLRYVLVPCTKFEKGQ